MKHLLRLILGLVALLLAQGLAAEPTDITAAARGVVRIVLVKLDKNDAELIGHGSGFAVTPDRIITNAHVVAPLASDANMVALVIPPQGKRGYTAKVAAYSPRNDLAMLRIVDGTVPQLTLSPMPVSDGSQVYAVGYPGSVDLAQGLDAVDTILPAPPVKTVGTVTTGRSSKSFDTILHTAPLGPGNSGGPLLDQCGRVVGVNSFSTVSDGGQPDFFFAVSMRELTRFLHDNDIQPRLNTQPCQSMADFERSEADRQAADQARADAAARTAADQHNAAISAATRQAELEVISSRDNRMALAGLALLGSIVAGGASLWFTQQGRPRERKAAVIGAAVLVVAAGIAWFSRPALSQIDTRAQEIVDAANKAPVALASAGPVAGRFICTLDAQRSRVTVSDMSDVPIDWSAGGCVNGRTQYGLGNSGWSRILVPNTEDTVSVAAFDPATRTYQTMRYLLDAATMAQARDARGRIIPPACGADDAAVRKFGQEQDAIAALLPTEPNEKLVYKCSEVQSGATAKP